MGQTSRAAVLKWMGFVSAIWIQAISGNNYSFSNYSVALKDVGSYNQVELNNLGVAKDVGKALGIVAGICADYLPAWIILFIGAALGLVGYGAQWLVLSGRIPVLPYWQMCIIMCLGGNSTTWMNTSVLVTCIRNFQKSRGPVVGILKGYIALSTAIFTVLSACLFGTDPAVFVLLLAVIPFAICIIGMIFLHPAEPAATSKELGEERKHMFNLNILATILAIYLLIYDVVGPLSGTISKIYIGICILVLIAPLYVPAKLLLTSLGRKRENDFLLPAEDSGVEEAKKPLLSKDKEPELAVPVVEDPVLLLEERKKLGDDHNVLEMLCSSYFWILFFSFLCGIGTGMVVQNNLGQIAQAQGYKDATVFVSLVSVAGFFGRILSGLISERFIRSSAIPRPAWLAVSQILMIVGFAMLAVGAPGSLYVNSAVVGVCYGVRLAVSVPTASELFGLKYFGILYNLLIINIPLGSFLFSGLIAGFLYDREVDNVSNLAKSCYGAHCYRSTFLVMIGICVVGCVLDVLLTFRTRSLYKRLSSSMNCATNRPSSKS